jgi:hypothetical protein
LKEEKDKVFSQAKVPTTQGVKLLCSGWSSSGSLGGFEESACLVGPHCVVVVVVHATIGDWNPIKQKGTCILPTTQASYYFWVLVSMSESLGVEVANDKKNSGFCIETRELASS